MRAKHTQLLNQSLCKHLGAVKGHTFYSIHRRWPPRATVREQGFTLRPRARAAASIPHPFLGCAIQKGKKVLWLYHHFKDELLLGENSVTVGDLCRNQTHCIVMTKMGATQTNMPNLLF